MKPLLCSILRDKSGFSKKFYPKYDMFLSNTPTHLISGQKMQLMRSAHYVISLEREDMRKEAAGYLGKVRSNLVGTEFNFFDKGENPSTGLAPERVRNQLGAVLYVPKWLIV
jgi:tubby-related protein 1